MDQQILSWLTSGDPSVTWQVERFVLGLAPDDWRATRCQVAVTGWGRALLDRRPEDGLWAAGLYSPKWTSTFYTLQTLAALGLPADHDEARRSTGILLERGVRDDGSVAWWAGAPDTCVGGMLLRTAACFGFARDERVLAVARHLLREQMADGGWNCRRSRGATHSSFHTTLSVLEGLEEWRTAAPQDLDPRPALAAGREFLLVHRLFRSHRDGSVVNGAFTRFSFPRYWYFDVLRALEHFATSAAPRDERANEAMALVADRRARDGRWRMGPRHAGATWLTMEAGGRPSRWITLSATRVLGWWADPQPPTSAASPAVMRSSSS